MFPSRLGKPVSTRRPLTDEAFNLIELESALSGEGQGERRALRARGFAGRRGGNGRGWGDHERPQSRERPQHRGREPPRGDGDGRGGGGRRGGGRGGRGHGRGGNRFVPAEPDQLMGWNLLNDLQTKPENEVLLSLTRTDSRLANELNVEDLSRDKQRVSLVLQLVCRALQCHSLPHPYGQLIATVRGTKFISDSRLSSFASKMMMPTNAPSQHDAKIIENGLTICQVIITRCPTAYEQIFPIFLTIKHVLETLINPSLAIPRPNIFLAGRLEPLTDQIEKLEQSLLRAQDMTAKGKEDEIKDEDYMALPNSFADLTILPQPEDILTSAKPFVRSNKKQGQFTDLTHYLDVQFRLLRADFTMPLQNGIQQYLQQLKGEISPNERLADIRVYQNVRILGPTCCNRGVGYRIQFDASKIRANWAHSKRLIFGSLVCLSMDNFKNIYFATVVERSVKDLQKGIVDIFFEQHAEAVQAFRPADIFIMVESNAFFEAYRHVLQGLQNIAATDEIPFHKYIVDCETAVDPPKYLDKGTVYDFKPIIPIQDNQPTRRTRTARALHVDDWPSAKELGFDDSQHRALKAGLQHEFALIQGPPGTGKTFLGWKITQILLHNKKFRGPILVVCFTNHALDQFLEGIIPFQSEGIIRVGGRSQSEQMEPYSLRNLRKKAKRKAELDAGRDALRREIGALYARKKELEESIERVTAFVDVVANNIVKVEALENVIDDRHLKQLMHVKREMCDAGYKKVKIMAEWLGFGNIMQQQQPVAEPGAVEEQQEEEEEEEIAVEDEGEAQNARRMLLIDDDERDTISVADMRKRHTAMAKNTLVELDQELPQVHQQAMNNGGWQVQGQERRRQQKLLKKNLREVSTMMTGEEASTVANIWALTQHNRWRLYHYWVHRYQEHLRVAIGGVSQEYQQTAQRLNEVHDQVDLQIMEKAEVIGMTTTGAARYHAILQGLRPKVVIIEEAAEVLEAHIITSLNPDVEHLILIGDHKQLRPTHTEYDLRRYNIDLSLFERMVNNDLECVCLSMQHRMRPEISVLMEPIYPSLKDHPDVMTFPHIKGVQHDLYFIEHTQQEEFNAETKSRANEFEAHFAAGLCQYLLKQGYEPTQITVLTTYSGQLHKLKKLMPKRVFEGVRLCVVDNFQGEENDIIILSLVRSNADGNIGFLRIDNRVCVALSRARQGFFVIGNFQALGITKLWQDILNIADVIGFRGRRLTLRCQNHPNQEPVEVGEPKDFLQVPEGGCLLPCDIRLSCGHVCPLSCHPYDRAHAKVKCPKPCEKVLCVRGHHCPKLCWEDCTNCTVPVEKTVPGCGHLNMMACHKSPDTFLCKREVNRTLPCLHVGKMHCHNEPSVVPCIAKCDYVLDCGHLCTNRCGEEHTERCNVMVERRLQCGHKGRYPCHRNIKELICKEKCSKPLECGHACGGTCGDCLMGRLHVACKMRCGRILVCGHSCADSCSDACKPCREPCRTRCIHSRCTERCGKECVPCREKCSWQCQHFKCQKRCSEPCDRPPCDQPCDKRLKCGHLCIGLCGEPCPNQCRVCNAEEVAEIFFGTEDEVDARFIQLEDCQHILEVSGLDHWMSQPSDPKGPAIQAKVCPKCKTPIRRNLRYSQLINSTNKDIEKVKRKMAGLGSNYDVDCRDILRAFKDLPNQAKADVKNKWGKVMKNLAPEAKTTVPQHQRAALKTFISIIGECNKEMEKHAETRSDSHELRGIEHDLQQVLKWALDHPLQLNPQEINDVNAELDRISLLGQLEKIEKKLPTVHEKRSQVTSHVIALSSGAPFDVEKKEGIKALIKELKKFTPDGLGITGHEREQIVQAMGLSKGHWFKCRNGHIYAIGDCGGATQVSRCPECREDIGGTGHRLLDSNTLAPEMDGAQHAAWSTHNDLNNFDIRF